ncbi:MAG TPA: FUSC family protein [Candidatus Avipropionibacterium avicola]|uniref:FUSC family protein n=1 Tax=Candidatus Avipropionibacterium avicola TaxID=2840701 RepID=A0A9D1GZQ0_9ACTN|nr:FUSC family protein [Candidatus Avipropionibacterium avicola]
MASRFSIQRVKLRAFDLSERSAAYGRRTLVQRAQRWQGRSIFLAQCAISAGLAWWLAQLVLGHSSPFFAPVAAVIVLGVSYGQRVRRALEVAVGVALGVGIGDVFVHLFGTGVWQIIVVAFVAMSVATLVNAGPLVTIQAGVQSIIVTTLLPDPSQGLSRWLDAAIGCALALLVATLAPAAPLSRPRIMAARVVDEVAATLRQARVALSDRDATAADAVLERARAGEQNLEALTEATTEGLAVARHSVLRRGSVPLVQAYADLAEPLDRLTRNLRVLARRAAVATWRGESVPSAYLDLLDDLATVVEFMAGELWDRRLPMAARPRLVKVGVASSALPVADSLSAVVILAQTRSMITDLLMLTGLGAGEARELIPEMD